MAENVLDAVKAAAAELAGEELEAPVIETPEVPEAPVETAEQKAERARDEAGRFAKEEKTRETLKLKPKAKEAPVTAKPDGGEGTPQVPVAPAHTAAETAPPKPAEEAILPPAEWKGGGKIQWNKLPKPIQAELREAWDGFNQAKAQLEPVSKAIEPYKDTLIRDAGSVESGVGQLMQFYNLYLTNPAGLVQHIVRSRGIDPQQVFGQPAQSGQQPQPATPDVRQLLQQIVQQEVAPIKQRFQQTEEQQLDSQIQSFAADPRYPYFNDVRVEMGRLMQAGLAKDLPDAYDKAVKLNPAIWTQLEAERTEEAKKAQAAGVAKAKQAAAASLRGSPLPGVNPGATSQGTSVLDSVRAAAAELSGA